MTPRAAVIVRFALVATPLAVAITVALSRQTTQPTNLNSSVLPVAVITESFKAYTPLAPPPELVHAPVLASERIERFERFERFERRPRERRTYDICRGRGRTWTTKPSGWRSWRCNRR